MSQKIPKLRLSILGCRGIPSNHGGFETFAERLALYLTSQGWSVTVYCQSENTKELKEETWQDINLVKIPSSDFWAFSSIVFDWKSVYHVATTSEDTIVLTLGYNTAIFCLWYRWKKIINIINMDGIEWRRQKWKLPEKIWLYLNEWCGSWLGNHLIADHPEIKEHLSTRVRRDKITVIPYSTKAIQEADVSLLNIYSLNPNQYALIIARPEPENHILEVVSAFSAQKRGINLVILGNYITSKFPYHQKVQEVASEEVLFLGAIYDNTITNALRFYTRLYIHGHSVGGTNPSLVEALATSSAILAHDNRFNRWVAGEKTHYFTTELDCRQKLDDLLENEQELLKMKQSSFQRYQEAFYEDNDLKCYEKLFLDQIRLKNLKDND